MILLRMNDLQVHEKVKLCLFWSDLHCIVLLVSTKSGPHFGDNTLVEKKWRENGILTFQNGAEFEAGDGAQTGKLSERTFKKKDREPSKSKHDDVGDQESP